MKKSNGQSEKKTLAFAATVAALGASLGVSMLAPDAHAQVLKGSRESGANAEVVQEKNGKQGAGAAQKWEANQYKSWNKAKTPAGPGSNNMENSGRQQRSPASAAGSPGGEKMLNPQPLPPGKQLPAVQK